MMATQTTPIFKPNRDKIALHLNTLFGDVPAGYEDGMIEITNLFKSEFFPVTNLNAAIDRAVELNTAQESVYTTGAVLLPNTVALIEERRQADKDAGIKKTSYRALGEYFYYSNVCWCDLDEIENNAEFKEKYAPAQPNYYVVTSRNDKTISTHFWWLLNKASFDKTELENTNKGILQALGGDKGTHNATRLMKLGGIVAWPKKAGRVTQMTENNNTDWFPTHAISDLAKAYPIEERQVAQTNNFLDTQTSYTKTESDGFSVDDALDMLNHISPDGGQYIDWLGVGMALHSVGAPFIAWDAWSSKGSTYPGAKELEKKWNGFTAGRGVGMGTLYYQAHEGGYKAADYRVAAKVHDIKHEINNIMHSEEVNSETGEVIEPKKMYTIGGDEMTYEPDDDDFVQGLLANGSMSVVYGESNCGKTFFMTDLSFHIAESKQWRDKRVEGGSVVYVALEGLKGLKGRVEAYKRETSAGLNGFRVMPCPFDFLDAEGDVTNFIELLKEEQQERGDIKLIVIDTLARAIGGGDENSGQDMGVLVRHADAIRATSGAHICFVHHSGKDKAKGARGHSSLRAAVDTEIEVSRNEGDDYSTVKVVKQRDMEMGGALDFQLKSIELGTNKHNEIKTSCVVVPYNAADDVNRAKHIKPNLRIAHEAFIECVGDVGKIIINKEVPKVKVITNNNLKEYMENRGILSEKESSARVQYSNYRKELIEAGLVVYRAGYLWISS